MELGEKLLPVVQYTISGAGTLTRIIATVAEFFTKNIATTITLTAAIAALTVAIEGQIIKQKLLAFWNGKVKKSLDALFTTISKHPFLFLAAGIAMVVARLIDMRRESESAITAQKAMEAASKKASDGFMEEEVRVKQLSKQVHDNKLALDLRRQALEQLKGIIPGYNALLDEEGRLTRDNTAAIDEYLKRRKQELLLKAYEEELVEAYKQQAKANEALSGMIEMYKAGSNWGWAKQSMFSRIKQEAIDANNAVAALEKAMEEAQHSLSKSMASPAGGDSYESGGSAATSQPENYNTRSYWEQELKRRQDKLSQLREDASSTAEMIEEASKDVKEAEEKMELFTGAKHEAREQRQEEHDRRERLRKANDAAKAETEQQVAELTHRYATGKVLYCDYVDEQERIQIEGIERRMLIYEEESLEYQKLARQREELLLNGSEERQKLTLAQMKVEHEQRVMAIKEQAWREQLTEQQKNEMVFREDMRFMDEQRILYRKGTLERINLERDIEERQQEHRMEQQQYYQQLLLQTREQLLQMGSERLMELELNNIDKVYDEMIRQGVAKEEERHEAILAVRAKYANYQTTTERDQQKASQMLSVARSDAKQKRDAAVPGASPSGSANLPFVGTIQQYQATMERLKELYGNDEQNHAAYLAAKQQATAQFCQELAAEMQAAYNTVNQVMQAASSYFSAQQEYETTIVQKKYEKQIDAAGNNQKKVKKLQEQQQKEEAAIKTKYAKRAATIQMAQAVAQTAISAINAYSSAAAIPVTGFVLAPIAAAAAIAAGLLQIATIKKQQQAQQAGYYEGGFTHGRRYRKEAGVVHEGEFVANHQAVENPAILPFLNFIDQAQRNNTVGSLTMQDVSRALSVGGGSAVAPITPIVNVQTDNEELRDAVQAHREATELLLMRLEQPINAQVVLTGPDGLNEQQRRLNNMMKNK